jgi:hypothetical protein
LGLLSLGLANLGLAILGFASLGFASLGLALKVGSFLALGLGKLNLNPPLCFFLVNISLSLG